MTTNAKSKQHVKQLMLSCANWLASKQSGAVSDVTYPDELDSTKKAVDLSFSVGHQRFVLEHTELQPFDDYYELNEPLATQFSAWARAVETRLPGDAQCVLEIPAKKRWFKSPTQRETALNTLGQWVLEQAPLLLARSTKAEQYVTSLRVQDNLVPFVATLAVTHRLENSRLDYRLRVSATKQVSDETDFRIRVERALEKKLPKLARAKTGNALSVLLFEVRSHVLEIGRNVVVGTHEFAIQFAPELIGKPDAAPDLIVIANTNPIENYWIYWVIKSGDLWFDDLAPHERFGHWWPSQTTDVVLAK